MAKKFTKANMYEWVSSPNDKNKLYELDTKAGNIIKEKVRILKKASQEYRRQKSVRTPAKARIRISAKREKV